jgi:hypothetical protein
MLQQQVLAGHKKSLPYFWKAFFMLLAAVKA